MIFDKVNVNWKKAVDYIVKGGAIADIEKKYTLSEENKELLITDVEKIINK